MSGEFTRLIQKLLGSGSLLQKDLKRADLEALIAHGFTIKNGQMTIPSHITLLSVDAIDHFLSFSARAWMRSMDILGCTESTNDVLVARAQTSSIHGNVVIAELQTAGRGRRGRKWISPFGRNVTLSFGTDMDIPIANVGSVSLALGVGVAKSLEQLGVGGVKLKWPNDIYVEGRKLGGILIDLLQAARPAKLLVGIGLNVQSAPEGLQDAKVSAIALNEVVEGTNRNQIVGLMLNHLVSSIDQFTRSGFSSFHKDWVERDAFAHARVQVDGLTTVVEGLNRGIDQTGALCIETETGIQKIVGGEVSLRRV